MISLRNSLFLAACSAFAASCSPYNPPPIPPGAADPGLNPNRQVEETTNTQQLKEAKKKKATVKKKVEKANSDSNAGAEAKPPSVQTKTAPEKPKVPTFPTAKKVPGREGFVYSPYDNTVIDVRRTPPGKLGKNPNDDASKKRYFRVPK